MSPRSLVPLFALLVAGSVQAGVGPVQDLHAAFSKFLAQTSFRGDVSADLAGHTMHSTVEFQAPDRVRVTAEGRPPVVMIGDTMYMSMNGHAMKVPMPGGNPMQKYRDTTLLERMERGLQVEDLGADNVDGQPTHKYRYTEDTPQPVASEVWVSVASGLPIRIRTHQTLRGKPSVSEIRYSGFGDKSIQIAAPN